MAQKRSPGLLLVEGVLFWEYGVYRVWGFRVSGFRV